MMRFNANASQFCPISTHLGIQFVSPATVCKPLHEVKLKSDAANSLYIHAAQWCTHSHRTRSRSEAKMCGHQVWQTAAPNYKAES